MKLKHYLFLVLFALLYSNFSVAQNLTPFSPRYNNDVQGDVLLIGNNILNRRVDNNGNPVNPNTPYNGTAQNGDREMGYIDIDTDATTFSSSSANLDIPTISDGCYQIEYAGLYWSGILQQNNRAGINNVKIKIPGDTNYRDITGTIVHDMPGSPIGNDNSKAYVCYYDITTMVKALANPQGNYTVANVMASEGNNGGTGLSAGWSIFVVYRDPNLVSKSIVTFDGFSGISGATTLDVPISGFRTIPSGPVRAKFAFSALEGDLDITGDYLRINGNTISTAERPADNFFKSAITDVAGYMNGAGQRTPNSSNTFGYDTGIITNFNPGNSVLANNATTATIRLGSTRDLYMYFFNAFIVDIIEPKIILTKVVQDLAGNDIGNANVRLCQDLQYVIGYQNTGNDDATNFTIRDVLPVNITFNPATDLTLPAGVTYTYNAGTRTIIFTVPNNQVNVGDPRREIRIRVKIICTCDEFDDACSNVIRNQAFATYSGFYNTNVNTDDPSLSTYSVCNLSTPSPTNFLVGLDDCNFTSTVEICGNNPITLTAANGYQSYLWSGPGIVGPNNTQTITVNQPGTYTVNNTITTSPCRSIVQTFIVTPYTGGVVTNPVIPYADQVVTCPNSNDPLINQLPLIFLCGAGDSQLIQTNIAGATSIQWQQLNTASCTAVSNPNCPNTGATCTWTTVATGANYTANTPGQFAMVINFPNGCKRTFYFNVFQNILNPQYVATDVICTTQGRITVTNVPAGYEYEISSNPGVWQVSNVFTPLPAGIYTIRIRQAGVTGGCIFTLPNIPIRARNFTVTYTLTQPLCGTDKGSINIAANDANPQYTFTILQGATVVATSGPIATSNYVFNNLNGGIYTYQVTTQDGCIGTGTFTINTISPLTVTAALTRPLSCTAGEITAYPVGGTPPYNFVVTGAVTVTQASPIIAAPVAGTYNIQVVDFNNCSASTSITITQVQPPVFTVNSANITCSTSGNTGTITINVTNANGNSIRYSIDNGTSWQISNIFTNLPAGTYQVVVEYTTGTSVCTTTPQAVTITIPNPIIGVATLTTPYTCTTNGVITFSGVSGGSPGYDYSIGGPFQAGNVFSGLTNGTYTPVIRDLAGCTLTLPNIIIAPLDPPTDLTFNIIRSLSCPSNTVDINVNINGSGGLPPLQYTLVSPPPIQGPNASGQFNNLAPGTYVFEVRDRNNCTYQESYTINPLPPLVVTGQLISNVRCFGTSTGSIRFNVSGFAPNYNYVVTGPVGFSGNAQTATIINLPNLPAGVYTITVTNPATNCTATASVTVNQPTSALTANLTSIPVTCLVNGSVTVNATGGWGGYTYAISPSVGVVQSGNTFSNLLAGTAYTITTTDSGGCSITNTITLVAPPVLSASISAASDFCYDTINGATLVVSASGGTPGYLYSINGGSFGPSNTFGSLTPGIYTIVVRDSFGCTVTLPAQTINPQLTLNTVLTKDLDCTASPNAVITGTVVGGYPGYTYQVSFNAGAFGAVNPVPLSGIFTYSTATAGNYQFLVTDSRGCTVQSSVITINPLVPVSATVVKVDNKCFGDTAGSVTITPSGGVGPYQINFNSLGFSNQTTYSGLVAGTYNYIVRDSKSCTFNGSVTITSPAQIVYTAVINPITCNIATNTYNLGSICVQALTGGVGPYTYTLTDLTNGGTLTHIDAAGANFCFPNVDFGIYDLAVTDTNGCTIVKNNLIMSSPPSGLTFTFNTVASCATGATITTTITGGIIGSGAYQFGIVNLPTFPWSSTFTNANPGPATHIFTGLNPGQVYTIVVRDMTTGCYYFQTAPAAASNSTLATTPAPRNVTCRGAADGRVSGTITGYGAGCTSISYVINYASTGLPVVPAISGILIGPAFNYNLGPLPIGSYTIYFRELNGANAGCGSTFGPFTIAQSAVDLTFTTTQTNANCNAGGQIAVSPSGGTAPYTYQYLVTGSPSPTAASPGWVITNPFVGPVATAGTYDVYVKDANDCIRTTTVAIGLDQSPVVAATLRDACVAQGTYQIDVTLPTVGIPPYTYSIDGGTFTSTFSAPFTISGLSSGPHSVAVRDKNGCGNIVNLNILNPITASAVFTVQPTCLNANGTITATASGGSGNYTYSLLTPALVVIRPAQAVNVFTLVVAGNYIVRVTDTTTGCIFDAPVSVALPDPVTFTLASTPPTCTTATDATITVTLGAGNNDPNYTYEIIAPIVVGPQASNVFTGLTATIAGTTYTVRVNSGRGCSITQNITITAPAAVGGTASLPTPVFTCNGSNVLNTTTITIVGSGGTGVYTYSIDGVNYFTTSTFSIAGTAVSQNITFYVKDANGCLFSNTIIVPAYTPLNALVVMNQTIDCTRPEIVTINATGGSGTYTYATLPSGASNVTQGVGPLANQFTITAPGTYYFRVTDAVTGCYFDTAPYVIAPFNLMDVIASATTAVTCFGGTNGAISINVSAYTGTYNYQVFDTTTGLPVTGLLAGNTALNPQAITGLPAGNFTVTVTQTASPFCTKTSNVVTVDGPSAALALNAQITAPLTCDPNTGVITATATGGWVGVYTYTLNPGNVTNTTGVFSGLGSNNYIITVTDSRGCTSAPVNLTLVNPTPINFTVTPNTTLLACNGDTTGTLTVSYPTGGQGSNYNYTLVSSVPTVGTISGPFAPMPAGGVVISGLGAGTYSVIVADGYNCSRQSANVTIAEPTRVIASLSSLGSSTCTLTAGTLQLSAIGGTPPYTYSTNIAGPYSVTTFNPSVIIPIAVSGVYHYFVRDANGCISTVSNDVQIDDITPLTITSLSHTDVLCGGSATGTITAVATGGLLNYTYQLLDAGGNPIVPAPAQPTPGYFTGLVGSVAGITYNVRVISNGICTSSLYPVVIRENTPLVVTAVPNSTKCNGGRDGFIRLTITGGTGTIQYAISPNLSQFFTITSPSSTFDIPNLLAGTYSVVVQDQNGCFSQFNNLVVTEPTPVTFDITSVFNERCAENDLGSFTISNIAGGNGGPYKVYYKVVYPDNTSFTSPIITLGAGVTSHIYSNLNGGIYTVFVLDSRDCNGEKEQVIGSGDLYTPEAIVTYPCIDNHPAVQIEVVNTTAPNAFGTGYTFSLNGATPQTNTVFTSAIYPSLLTVGAVHRIEVFGPNGCNKFVSPNPIPVNPVSQLTVTLQKFGLNKIKAIVNGGIPDYNYTFDDPNDFYPPFDNGNDPVYVYDHSATYIVTVTDSSGCSATDKIQVEFVPICVPNVFTPNGDGNADEWAPGCIENYPKIVTLIYDRYGREVARLNRDQKWDGKYNGSDLPSGDYWYVIRVDERNAEELVGHFTLYR